MKITINNEEVLCDKNFTINEEMLNTSSVILNNVYPATWEQDKDYVSRFYYPKDYSKCKIFNEIVHPTTREDVEGTNFSINVDTTKQYQVQTLKGQTSQSGTPTPSSPIPINITTGRQVVSVVGKNLFNKNSPNISAGFLNATGGITLNSSFSTSDYINVENHTKATTSGRGVNNSERICFYDINKTFISTVSSNNVIYTFNIPSTAVYMRVTYKNTDIDTFMVEYGTTATTYEAYNGTDYEINLGKNLLNTLYQHNAGDTITSSDVNYTFNEDGSITIDGTASGTSYVMLYGSNLNDYSKQRFIVNGDYTVGNWDVNNISLMCRDQSGTYKAIYKGNNYSGTDIKDISDLPLGVIYIQVSGTVNNLTIYPMIEKGPQATTYAPYKTPIYLGKIGTYQDYIFKNTTENPLYDSNLNENEWYIHKEIGRVVLDGSESGWDYNTLTQYPVAYRRINDKISSRSGVLSNYFSFNNGGWYASPNNTISEETNNNYIFIKSDVANTLANFKTWLGTHPTDVYYVLATPTNTLIEDEELINQLNSIQLLEGLNNVSVSSPYLPFIMSLMYNYQEGYTEEDMLFCGVVENTGNISLNPRYPHYCNLQVLDFKTFLSEGETLDFVIYEKTIQEAIEQVINAISEYGFVIGNINLLNASDTIGAYSTKDKTAYDVFNYIADITQSRWTTRMINENTVAIDFYDPSLMNSGTAIEYTQQWFEDNNIIDMQFNYSSKDYRNKQVMTSSEVYANIETNETIVADGYQTQFNTTDKIGNVSSMTLNGTEVVVKTKEEYDLGYSCDFYYTPGNKYFESADLVSAGGILVIEYYAIIEGREILLDNTEINRVNSMTGRKGIVARYENRNDATTTTELSQIGQSYLKYKGTPEITLKVDTLNNIWNIGDNVSFTTSPLTELATDYMVKKKSINYITTQDNLFYTYELTSSFNSETAINYFDNQRSKANGNIGQGETISRNIDISNTANVIFYDLEVSETSVSTTSELQSELQTPLGVE